MKQGSSSNLTAPINACLHCTHDLDPIEINPLRLCLHYNLDPLCEVVSIQVEVDCDRLASKIIINMHLRARIAT